MFETFRGTFTKSRVTTLYQHHRILSRSWPRLRGVDLCALGVVLLAASLIGRHNDWGTPIITFNWGSTLVMVTAAGVLSWLGSILVVVGLGRMLFLEP
jgi:hypothetical protein